MPFEGPPQRIPTSLGRVSTSFDDWPEGEGPDGVDKVALYDIEVLDQNGERIHYTRDRGDLIPHITPAMRQAALDFMATVRQIAAEEIFGGS